MEKVRVKNSRGSNLVGELKNTESNSIVVMCHGYKSDKEEEGRFNMLVDKLYDNGYSTLRFDFGGHGESDKDTLTVENEVEDLNLFLEYVKNLGFSKIILLGYSLGGLVVLKSYDESIESIVLWAPVTDRVKYSWERRYSKEELENINEYGYISDYNSYDKEFFISNEYLKERENVNQRELLSKISCDTLIIHGDCDKVVSVEDSKRAIKYLSQNSSLEIIEGGNHWLRGYEKNLIEKSVEWIKTH